MLIRKYFGAFAGNFTGIALVLARRREVPFLGAKRQVGDESRQLPHIPLLLMPKIYK
jgi:hypothetical protein